MRRVRSVNGADRGQIDHVEVVSRLQLNDHSLPHASGIRVPVDRTGLALDEDISRSRIGWVWIGMYEYSSG